MSEIKTLTINGQSYTVADPDAAHIDDAAVGEKAWSSRRIMEAVEEADSAIVCSARGTALTLTDASGRKLRGLTLYGKTTQNGTPTPNAPVPLESPGDSGSIGVNVLGGNLFNAAKLGNHSATYEISEDTYTVTVTGKDAYSMVRYHENTLFAGRTLCFAMDSATSTDTSIRPTAQIEIVGSNEARYTITSIKPKETVIVPADCDGIIIKLYANPEATALSADAKVTFKGVRITFADEAAWTPYKEPQALSVATPEGLPGIPVTSGGNYTDSTGQQWVCDGIDFGRGIYAQRVLRFGLRHMGYFSRQNGEFDTANRLLINCQISALKEYAMTNRKAKCNLFEHNDSTLQNVYLDKTAFNFNPDAQYSQYVYFKLEKSRFSALDDETVLSEFQAMMADVEIICTIPTPLETPLTVEELAAFAALHTNKPNTTVCSDASMEVSYVADTKRYIDNKLAAISAAMLKEV